MHGMRYLWPVAVVMAVVWILGCTSTEPTVWYCLAYNTPNHRQYHVDDTGDRGWSRVHASLAPHVNWRVDANVPTAPQLADVDVVIILNPDAEAWQGGPVPRLMGDEDTAALAAYVRGGGALLFGSNQDEGHNIEKPRSNRLLERFGMQVGHGDIGLKVLDIPASAPVVGGLRWRFFIGSPVELIDSAEVRPQIWVWNDPAAPTLEGEPGERMPILAAAEVGAGRVIVMGDSGWAANGTIGLDDNWTILWRMLRWLTRDRLRPEPPALSSWSPPAS